MQWIGQGIVKALEMLLSGEGELWRVAWLTLRVSGTATLLSVILGVPVGVLLALTRFRLRWLTVSVVHAGMGLPPVVVGLVVSILLWRSGPLGDLRLIYTPTAMIIAQTMIATPIVTGLTMSGVQQLHPKLHLQILALGASRWQLFWLLVREARMAIIASVIAGFGRVVAEVGASMMVGANIVGETRVLTTAMVLEVNKGNFDMAIALSLILMLLIWLVISALTRLQQGRRPL